MRTRERIILMVEVLRRIRAGEADWAVFEDAEQAENFVQIGIAALGTTYVEVTTRTWEDARLPKLTSEQVDALASLGFGRNPDPNHSAFFDWPDPVCIAKLCETAFQILGCPPDFDLKVANMHFWSSKITKRKPRSEWDAHPLAEWSRRQGFQAPHPDPCRQEGSARA